MTSRIALASLLLWTLMGCMPIGLGAAAIVRPLRLPRVVGPPLPHQTLEIPVNGVTLRGWLFEPATRPARGLVVYLHGKDDNRSIGALVAKRFVPKGYAVLAYDQRAHGQSTGRYCSYGAREKWDLKRVLDLLLTKALAPAHPEGDIRALEGKLRGVDGVYVIGHSLGGAVALQAAGVDGRIRAVVAISTFSELEDIVRDRAPAFAREEELRATMSEAERKAGFRFSQASPLSSARRLRVPVLLIHGRQDAFTSFAHSERLFSALPAGTPKGLVLIEGAGHQDILRAPRTWDAAADWLETHGRAVPARPD